MQHDDRVGDLALSVSVGRSQGLVVKLKLGENLPALELEISHHVIALGRR